MRELPALASRAILYGARIEEFHHPTPAVIVRMARPAASRSRCGRLRAARPGSTCRRACGARPQSRSIVEAGAASPGSDRGQPPEAAERPSIWFLDRSI